MWNGGGLVSSGNTARPCSGLRLVCPVDSRVQYLENFFREEWNKEFGSDYAIYEYIRENKGIEDFLLDEEAVS